MFTDELSHGEQLINSEPVQSQFVWTPLIVLKVAGLFLLAGLAEIGGGWLVWQAVREGKPWWWAVAGSVVLVGCGFVPTLQPLSDFGRLYAVYGGIFIALSYLWGYIFDGVCHQPPATAARPMAHAAAHAAAFESSHPLGCAGMKHETRPWGHVRQRNRGRGCLRCPILASCERCGFRTGRLASLFLPARRSRSVLRVDFLLCVYPISSSRQHTYRSIVRQPKGVTVSQEQRALGSSTSDAHRSLEHTLTAGHGHEAER